MSSHSHAVHTHDISQHVGQGKWMSYTYLASSEVLNMVWQCPVIAEAWTSILNTITEITETETPDSLESCLLGIRHITKQTKYKNKFINLALALFKRQIAMNWKSSKAPDPKTWLKILLKWSLAEVRAMEEITGRESNPVGRQLWDRYIQCLTIKNDIRPP